MATKGRATGSKRRILVLDDSPSVLEFARMTLEDGGYEVDTAINVAEMVACLEGHSPDLLLVDVNMPELFGHDLVPYLRDVRGVKAPIALFSTLDEAELAEFAQKSGADGYIHKSPDLVTLLPEVEKIFVRAGPRARKNT